jgi:tetratricopeptide (TPR) repeat protein
MNNIKYLITFVLLSIISSSMVMAAGSDDSSSSSSNYSSDTSSDKYDTTSSALTKEDKSIKTITIALSKDNYESGYNLSKAASNQYPKNADAWNYLGFSSRKLGKYEESETAYKIALSIEPNHVGALEYYGELHLTMKRPEKAKDLLVKLKSLCTLNCKEMMQLELAIKKYESQ